MSLALGPLRATAAPTLQLDLGLEGASVSEPINRAQWAGLRVGAHFRENFNNYVGAEAHAVAQLQSGSSRALFEDIYGPQQRINLRSAFLEFKPAEWITGAVGAFNQQDFDSPFFHANRTHPGLSQSLLRTWRQFSLAWQSYQLVPASPSSVSARGEDPGIPLFLFERLTASWTASSWMELSVWAGHFAFSGLSASTAQSSRTLGGEVTGIGDGNARFLTSFQGLVTGAKLSSNFSERWQPNVSTSYLRNYEGRLGAVSESWTASTGLKVVLGSDFYLTPSVAVFRLGADTIPAYYGNSNWGFNNREGFEIKIEAGLGIKYDIMASYSRSTAITQNSYQGDFNHIQFGLGTRYELF